MEFSGIIGVVVGAVITWLVADDYYQKASEDLERTEARLRQKLDELDEQVQGLASWFQSFSSWLTTTHQQIVNQQYDAARTSIDEDFPTYTPIHGQYDPPR